MTYRALFLWMLIGMVLCGYLFYCAAFDSFPQWPKTEPKQLCWLLTLDGSKHGVPCPQ